MCAAVTKRNAQCMHVLIYVVSLAVGSTMQKHNACTTALSNRPSYYLCTHDTIQHSDMNEEMRVEAMELCVTACEKHSASNEVHNNSDNYVIVKIRSTCTLYNPWACVMCHVYEHISLILKSIIKSTNLGILGPLTL